jgi:putative peptidoglycan lipid II flippase
MDMVPAGRFATIKNVMGQSPILKASLKVGTMSVIIKVAGYLEKVILAYYFGTSYQVDVYSLVLNILLSIYVFYREIVEPSFLKPFNQAQNEENERHWDVYFYFLKIIAVTSIAVAVVLGFNADRVINILTPGLKPASHRLAVLLFQLGCPAIVFLAMSSLNSITLNAFKNFTLPIFAELAFKVAVLITLLSAYYALGIKAAMVGVLIGSVAKFCIQSYPLYKKFPFKHTFRRPDMSEVRRLSFPLFLGMGFSQLNTLVQGMLISYAPEGSVAALGYAKKIVDLPIIIVPYIISTVAFPYFSEYSLAEDHGKLSRSVSTILAWMIVIFIPVAAFICCFSLEIVEVVFKHGVFGSRSSLLTSIPLSVYAVGLPFFAVEAIIVVFFYAIGDTRRPIITGIISVVVDVVIILCCIQKFGYVVIAAALVVSKAFKVCLLLRILDRQEPGLIQLSRYFVFKATACGIPLIILFALFRKFFSALMLPGFLSNICLLVLAAVAGVIVYMQCIRLCKINLIDFLKDPAG